MSDLDDLHARWGHLASLPGWRLNADQQQALQYFTAAAGAPATRRACNWISALDEVIAFRTGHDRWPAAHSGVVGERRLARWMQYQRQNRAGLTSYQAARLELAGVMLDPRDHAWWENAIAYETWLATHGRRPQARSGAAAERRLARWISSQRGRRDRLRGAKRRFLDRVDPLDSDGRAQRNR